MQDRPTYTLELTEAELVTVAQAIENGPHDFTPARRSLRRKVFTMRDAIYSARDPQGDAYRRAKADRTARLNAMQSGTWSE